MKQKRFREITVMAIMSSLFKVANLPFTVKFAKKL